MPARDAVTAYLRTQTRALMAQDPRVRRDQYDSVHRMRVAARRLRSALRTFRPLLDSQRADALEPELRWLGAVLGDPRDREVLHARLQEELDSLPPDAVLGSVAEVFDKEMLGGLRQAQEQARAQLRNKRYLDLVDLLVAFAADPPVTDKAERPAATVLPRLVAKAWRRLDRAVRAAQASQRDEDWHEARKAGKRARYAAEAVEVVHGGDAADLAAQAETVQEVLGEHQDSVVAREVLRRLAAAHNDAGFTLGSFTESSASGAGPASGPSTACGQRRPARGTGAGCAEPSGLSLEGRATRRAEEEHLQVDLGQVCQRRVDTLLRVIHILDAAGQVAVVGREVEQPVAAQSAVEDHLVLAVRRMRFASSTTTARRASGSVAGTMPSVHATGRPPRSVPTGVWPRRGVPSSYMGAGRGHAVVTEPARVDRVRDEVEWPSVCIFIGA